MSCILVLFVVVQILFHSSLSALVVEASRSWCGIGMLDSFVRSVVASFSFPSIPWCDGLIIICLWCMFPEPFVWLRAFWWYWCFCFSKYRTISNGVWFTHNFCMHVCYNFNSYDVRSDNRSGREEDRFVWHLTRANSPPRSRSALDRLSLDARNHTLALRPADKSSIARQSLENK